MEINNNKQALEDRKKVLKDEKDGNKELEMKNELLERQKISQISENKAI